MKATIHNLSQFARTSWATITYPTAKLSGRDREHATFRTDTGEEWWAIRGAERGRTTVYRVRCKEIAPRAFVQGILEPGWYKSPPFQFHPWVSDDFAALIPKLGAVRNGQIYQAQPIGDPQLVESSSAHMRWKYEAWIKPLGLKLTWWAEILSRDPVVRCWGKVAWSDRADPNYNTTIDAIVLATREPFVLDFAQRHGVRPASFVDGEWMLNLTTSAISMQDGCALPLSGVMLCQPQGERAADTADDEDALLWQRAAIDGPLVGVAHVWDGEWLAHRNVPRLAKSAAIDEAREREWASFVAAQSVPAGWYAARPIGCQQTPWQTGDQEDFGACKGTHLVTANDPRFLRLFQYAAYAEAFRGGSLLEADGSPLKAANHPQWVTWNGVTHWHTGVSVDRLGKSFIGTPASGWHGYDDEHRSQNNLAAYAMLADDPLAHNLIACQLELDLASYRSRYPTMGQGAARAQGRTLQAFAQLLVATDDVRWAQLIAARVPHMLANPTFAGPNVQALHVGSPDARKQVYDPATGLLAPWVSLWEHGLAAVGLYAAHKTDEGNADLYECLRRVCRLLLTHGWFRWEGQWYTTFDIRWAGGAPLMHGLRPDMREIVAEPNAGSVGSWTFAGILIAREVLGTTPQLDEYVRSVTGNSEAWDRRTAEWWAAVRSVVG